MAAAVLFLGKQNDQLEQTKRQFVLMLVFNFYLRKEDVAIIQSEQAGPALKGWLTE